VWFGFTSDWLRKWCENFKPIDKRCKVEQKKVRITSNTLVKKKQTTLFAPTLLQQHQ